MGEATPQIRAVNTLVEAFRARDLNKFASLIHQDFIWNDGDGNLIGGKQALLDGVSTMWRDHPDLKNEVSECIQVGNLVAHSERFSNFNGLPDEAWMWIYEFTGDLMTKMIGHKAF